MKYFDSHAHYYDARFENEIEESADNLIGALLSGMVFFLELGGIFNQFSILIYQLLICAASIFITYSTIPQKDYFDIEAFFAQFNEPEEAEDSADALSDDNSEASVEESPDTNEVKVEEEI